MSLFNPDTPLDIKALKLNFDQLIIELRSIEIDICRMRLGLQAGDMMLFFDSDCIIKSNSNTATYSQDRPPSIISTTTDSIYSSLFDEESIISSVFISSATSSIVSYPSWTSSMDTLVTHTSEDSSASHFNPFLTLQEVEGLFPYYFH